MTKAQSKTITTTPKAVRLTKHLQRNIVRAAVNASDLKKKHTEYDEKMGEIFEQMRLLSIGGAEAERELLKAERRLRRSIDKAIPENVQGSSARRLVDRHSWMTIICRGERHTIVFENEQVAPSGYTLKKPDEITLFDQYTVLKGHADDIREQMDALRRDVYAAVSQFTTTKKLLEAWPELEPHVVSAMKSCGMAEQAEQTKALTIPVRDLNNRLGLPA